MSTAANTSVDYEDEVFDNFDDVKTPVRPSAALGAAAVADDDLVSAAHLAKTTSGAAASAGSDDDLEPVYIQLTVNAQGSAPAVLNFDDSISYDEFKKRLSAIGCDRVTYRNMADKDVTISDEKQLDLFVDMMVDDYEGENKLKGSCAAIGLKVSSPPTVDSTSLIADNTDNHDSKAPARSSTAPAAVATAPAPAFIPAPTSSHQSLEPVALNVAEAIQAHGEFKPAASLDACSSLHAIITAVQHGSLKFAWQHLPELHHELTALDTQRSGIASATQVSAVLTRVLKLQSSNVDMQKLLSCFGGDTSNSGSIIIEQVLHAFTFLSPIAVKALESVRNAQLQNGPSVSGFRTFNSHSMACGHDSTVVRCAVLDLCLENSKDGTASSIPVSALLSKYSSTNHKIDLAALTSVCAEVGAITDVSSMSINPFHVTRNLALATQHEVTLITQCLVEQAGRRAVMSVAETLLASLRATCRVEKRKSINPFASSKPVQKLKTDNAVVDALNSGCSGNADALRYLLTCSAEDNISLVAFVEGLHWVESTGVLPDVSCSSFCKNLQQIMEACAAKDTRNSGVIPFSEFTAIVAQHPCDASVTNYFSSVAQNNLIDYRHMLLQRILVLTVQESAVLSSWTSASQQSLRTFLVAHSHTLNVQFIAAATKSNYVPRKTVKSCISKLPSIGARMTDQFVTQLLDGCTANSTSDPDVFFLDTMTATSVRLLQLSALQDSMMISRVAISAAAVASGLSDASCPVERAIEIVASAIPARHSLLDISSFLCQYCNSAGSIELYRAIQSLVRLPVDAHNELVSSFHGPSSAVVQHFCTLFSLHVDGSPVSGAKPIEEIASAPGVPLAKSLYKAAPSLTFGHGALSMLLARISKGGFPQVSMKQFLQQLIPSVAVLTPAVLVLKSAGSAQGLPCTASPSLPTLSVTNQLPFSAPSAAKASSSAAKVSNSVACIPTSTDSKSGLTRARVIFRKSIRANRPSSLDVLRMLGVSTSLFPSALSAHEATGKSSLVSLMKTTSHSSSPLHLSGMWPTLKSVLPCSVFDLRVIEAKFVPSAGALYTSINRKVRVTLCNGVDNFLGSLASVSAKTHRGDDHSWDFPSAQILSVAVSQATIDAYPKGGVLVELSIVVTKKFADGQAAGPAVPSTAGRDMSAGWAMIPWAELKAGTKTITLNGGLPWAQQKIQPEDCGNKKGFFGLSKAQAPVSSVTLKLEAVGEAAHFPDKCVCPKNAVPLLQLYALFLRSQISSLFGQSSAIRNPMFHNLLLSAFPSLINEAPLRNALISQFSDLGGNAKASLASLADPQNREVLNQIKFLHRAVSLLQPLLHVHGLHWGVAALHEDVDTAAKKEKIVNAFAVDPISFLCGKISSIENGAVEILKFEPTRAKELCFNLNMQ